MQDCSHFSLISAPSNTQLPLYPVGYVARVEADMTQINAVIQNHIIGAIMLNIDDAEKLLKMGLDTSYFGSNKLVITTSTIDDRSLPKYYLEKEVEVVTDFGPKFHVPRDRPVYLSQNKKERLWNIRTQVEDTIEMRQLLNGTSTKLIPLLKGIDQEELHASYIPLKNEGFDAFTYYTAQYFGNGRGNLSTDLITDVRVISTLPNIGYVMLIGVQSENIIRKLPPVVKAYAGLRFIKENCWNQPTMKDLGQSNLSQFPNSGGF